MRTVLARIDHVRQGEEWAPHVERVRATFIERNGAKMLDDLRADIRLRLLEEDPGLGASVAALSLASLDGAIAAASGGDLDRVVGHMQGTMEQAVDALASPDASGEDVSAVQRAADDPACVALAVCLAWAYSSFIAAMIVCFAVPFCWCCYAAAAIITWVGHQALCVAILGTLCNPPA